MKTFDLLESEVRGYCRSWPVVFESASGWTLTDEDGRRYLDFFAGAGALNYGHNHPDLVDALIAHLRPDGIVHGLDLATTTKRTFLECFEQVVLRPRGLHTEDGMPAPRAVSCSILLTENLPYNGPLLTIAGSHHWYVSCVGETPQNHYEESLRQEVGTPDDASLAELCSRGRIAECLGPVGTVVFFDSNMMHGSNSNITPYPRRNLFLVYNSVHNALGAPFAAESPRPEHIASRRVEPLHGAARQPEEATA